MRTFAVALLSLCLVTFAAAEEKLVITKEVALKAMMAFRQDPTAKDARDYAAIVVRFIDESPDVTVSLSEKVGPWLQEGLPQRDTSLLLAAFAAGNASAQLATGNKKDQPLAGVQAVIEAYDKLRQKNPRLRSPGVEKLKEMAARQTLAAYLAETDKR